jgi:hypothetical protein
MGKLGGENYQMSKTTTVQHRTLMEYQAALTADGAIDPVLPDAINALGDVGANKINVQFDGWTGTPAQNNEVALNAARHRPKRALPR